MFLRSLPLLYAIFQHLLALSNCNSMDLFDFTTMDSLDGWWESSDTVREVFQRAVFFSMLNPQPNGAGFAGVRTDVSFDVSGCSQLELDLRAQGSASYYKVLFRHNGETGEGTFEQVFQVSTNNSDFQSVSLDLSNFKFFYRGQEVPDHETLNTANITQFGFQVFGGVYSEFKQNGVSTLEINHVRVK